MRICPKCGYEDLPCWRVGSHMLYSDIDICRISELEEYDKELAEKIRSFPVGDKRNCYRDKYYAYYLTKKGWVYRQPLFLWKVAPFSKPDAEKYVKAKFEWPKQKTLLEV